MFSSQDDLTQAAVEKTRGPRVVAPFAVTAESFRVQNFVTDSILVKLAESHKAEVVIAVITQ